MRWNCLTVDVNSQFSSSFLSENLHFVVVVSLRLFLKQIKMNISDVIREKYIDKCVHKIDEFV